MTGALLLALFAARGVTAPDYQHELRGVSLSVMEYLPDGSGVAVADGGNVDVLDPRTGQPTTVLHSDLEKITALDWSPDGSLVAGGGRNGMIAVWKWPERTLIRTIAVPDGTSAVITHLAFLPDGRRLYASDSGTTWIVDVSDFSVLATLPGIASFAISPDGESFVGWSRQGTLARWRATDGTVEWSVSATSPGSYPRKIAWSQDGRHLSVHWGLYREFNLHDAATGRPVRTVLGAPGLLDRLMFSPDSTLVFACGFANGARLAAWRVLDGELVRVFDAGNRDKGCDCAAIRPDGREATLFAYPLLVTWNLPADLASGTAPIRELPSGASTATSESSDGPIVLDGGGAPITRMALSDDGKWLAAGRADGTTAIWSAIRGAPLRSLPAADGPTADLGFSMDGLVLVSVDATGGMTGWRWISGDRIWSIMSSSPGPVVARVIPGHGVVAVADASGTVRIVGLADGKPAGEFSAGPGVVADLVGDPDPKTVIVGLANGRVERRRLTGGRFRKVLAAGVDDREAERLRESGQGLPVPVRLIPGGRFFHAGTWIVRLESGEYQDRFKGGWPGPSSYEFDGVFSRDGGYATGLTGSDTFPIWRLPDGNVVRTLERPKDSHAFKAGALSLNGKVLALADENNVIWLWRFRGSTVTR